VRESQANKDVNMEVEVSKTLEGVTRQQPEKIQQAEKT
jgi:hypothetical protein